jgi:predicted Zn-dependent protease
MNSPLLEALRSRKDLIGWTLRRQSSQSTQLFTIGSRIEAERRVVEERFLVDVIVPTTASDGTPGCGTGNAILLPEDPVGPAIERAVDMARRAHNPLHGLPGPAGLPDVPLEDPGLASGPEESLRSAYERVRRWMEPHKGIRLTATEWHSEARRTDFLNSRGMEGEQSETDLYVEWVLVSGDGDSRAETFFDQRARRLSDLPGEGEVEPLAAMTIDRRRAGPAPTWKGPVILRDRVLGVFLNGGPIQFRTSAEKRYAKVTTTEIGKSFLRREGSGDPLTVYASRILPFGLGASRFDSEGIPGQRLLLISENAVKALSAAQRYAEYLQVPATGGFGDLELPPGKTSRDDLMGDPHVEIVGFSWFNPDPVTGDFATEIRLGYHVENGRRTPFRGGMLIGNFLDALGDARWSRETGFYGSYLGPTAVRLQGLMINGRTAG